MTQRIALQPVPSQNFTIGLLNQQCEISIYQRGANLYFDLRVGGEWIVRTRVIRNKQLLLIDVKYKGFRGDFLVNDTQGDTQPQYTGLGSRYLLLYVEPTDG